MNSKQTEMFIRKVQARRHDEGLSLRQLAAIVGVSFSTLAKWERGETVPDEDSIHRLTKWLVDGKASEPRRPPPKVATWRTVVEDRLAAVETKVGLMQEGLG